MGGAKRIGGKYWRVAGGGVSQRMKEGGCGERRSNRGRRLLPSIDLLQSGMAGHVMKCEIWRERPRARCGQSGELLRIYYGMITCA